MEAPIALGGEKIARDGGSARGQSLAECYAPWWDEKGRRVSSNDKGERSEQSWFVSSWLPKTLTVKRH